MRLEIKVGGSWAIESLHPMPKTTIYIDSVEEHDLLSFKGKTIRIYSYPDDKTALYERTVEDVVKTDNVFMFTVK